jgi:putative sterol carrier protein
MVDTKYFAVKMLMGAIQYAATQLAEMDPNFKKKLAGIDSITQWKVEPNGPNSYTIVKNSTIENKMDAIHEKPTFTISLKDLSVGLDLFQGKIEAAKAISEGKITIQGNVEKALKQMFILEDLAGYLEDIVRR